MRALIWKRLVINFINEMEDGDFAAVIKFNTTNPAGASVVVPFTEIDSGAGNPELIAGVQSDYPGNGTNTLDALMVALNHIISPPATLPDGPKAVILVGDGGDNDSTASEEDIVALANENSVPIFTIGVGDFALPGRTDLLDEYRRRVRRRSSFRRRMPQTSIEAYTFVADLLNNEYLIAVCLGHHGLRRARDRGRSSVNRGTCGKRRLHTPRLRHRTRSVQLHLPDWPCTVDGGDLGNRDDHWH